MYVTAKKGEILARSQRRRLSFHDLRAHEGRNARRALFLFFFLFFFSFLRFSFKTVFTDQAASLA
jgi:hypothetical protein